MFGQDTSGQQFGQDMTGFGMADPTTQLPSSPSGFGDQGTSQGFDPSQIVNPAPSAPPAEPSATSPQPSAPATVDSSADDLLDIKQQALQHLSPLVSHLDQSPEEKFKTTMMMIQASDDQTLIKDAYEAAQQISDEKARAQALLDVVNEINYFTQHNNGQ